MSYLTYEDAKAHEQQLLRLAQRQRISATPRVERVSVSLVTRILSSLRERRTVATRVSSPVRI